MSLMLLGLLGLLATAAASPARPFSEERILLDRRLETLRRILPDGPNALADSALVKELAQGARLSGVEALARPPVESGSRGDVIVDVSAFGRFVEVDRFFRQVALSHRLIDVESLSLTATPEDTVRLVAVLRLPFRPVKAPLPPPPDGTRGRLSGVPKVQADGFIRDQALALAKSEAIAILRRARRNPRLFLSELAATARDRPVVVSHASLGGEFLIRGLTVGEGPIRALETRLERGFFRVSEFLMAKQGSCIRFEAKGQCPVAGLDAELPLPSEDPFDQEESPCLVDRDRGRNILIDKSATGKRPGNGPVTLRLRDVDLTDVFRVLALLTSQGFIVDGDVTGRVSAELARVTLEEAVASLAKAGFKVSGPGPLRRVSVAGGPPLKAIPVRGGTPTIGFALKRAEVREVLAVMTDADPSLAALGPQGSLGRLSLWAKDAPLLDLRAALLDAVGLIERTEEGRRMLERHPGSDEALLPVAGTPAPRRLALNPHELTVREFELSGLAAFENQWIALTYSPSGGLNAYRTGDRLADGVVKAVESTDVVLETGEGPVRISLPPLP